MLDVLFLVNSITSRASGLRKINNILGIITYFFCLRFSIRSQFLLLVINQIFDHPGSYCSVGDTWCCVYTFGIAISRNYILLKYFSDISADIKDIFLISK